MKKQRLLKLADLLEEDARKRTGVKFNMSTVINTKKAEDGMVKLDCGTQACAMGLAALSGAFKRAGLGYEIGGTTLKDDGSLDIFTTMEGEYCEYDKAASELFEITPAQADFLFHPGYYPNEKLRGAVSERFVARRIRDFVAGKVGPGDEA